MKRHLSAAAAVLLGGLAVLAASTADAHEKNCACDAPPRHAVHHVHAAKTRAHVIHRDADADTVIHHDADVEFAQSAYDYQSQSVVREVSAPPPVQPWMEAPQDQSFYYSQGAPSYYSGPAPGYEPPPMGYGAYGAQGYGAQAYGPPAYGPPMAYGPAPCDCDQFTGGVGYGAGQDVFVDGYGQTHFFSHPVAPQGGFSQGGYGRERFAPMHGFNFRGGLSNGY